MYFYFKKYRTIPESKEQCENNNCDTDFRFGMNEDYDFYESCNKRERNKGLLVVDQVQKFNFNVKILFLNFGIKIIYSSKMSFLRNLKNQST